MKTTTNTDAKTKMLTTAEWEWADALHQNKGVSWAEAVDYVLSWR